jgi:calcium-dependent protein kinase
LVLELCDGGELFDRIVEETEKHEGSAFCEQDVGKYMTQILGAMCYLHSDSMKVAHRDIKPENFLLQNKTREAEIKVIDFGLAKQFGPGMEMTTKAGTPYYVAPEVLKGGGYDEKCDIWSCGVICYILICGYPPFYGDSDNDILKSVKTGKFDFPAQDWGENSKEVKDFITAMLTLDTQKRPSAAQLLEHQWLQMVSNNSAPTVELGKRLAEQLGKFTYRSKFQKVVLTMIATNLPDDEIADLRNTFQALDANKDGTLTLKEIDDGLRKHNINGSDDFQKMLAGLDTDGSGTIDYTEFLAATVKKKTHINDSRIWTAFRMFDKDGDGQITKNELHEILKDPDFKESAEILKEADTDGSDSISFEEFKVMLDKKGSILPRR